MEVCVDLQDCHSSECDAVEMWLGFVSGRVLDLCQCISDSRRRRRLLLREFQLHCILFLLFLALFLLSSPIPLYPSSSSFPMPSTSPSHNPPKPTPTTFPKRKTALTKDQTCSCKSDNPVSETTAATRENPCAGAESTRRNELANPINTTSPLPSIPVFRAGKEEHTLAFVVIVTVVWSVSKVWVKEGDAVN